MTTINEKEYNQILNEVLAKKELPNGFGIEKKHFGTYACKLESEEIGIYIYRERYFSPIEINLHLKKLNLKYEIFSLVEALSNNETKIQKHILQEGLFYLKKRNFKKRFWLKNPIQSNDDFKKIFDIILDWYIEEVIPLIKLNGENIEKNRRQYFSQNLDDLKEKRNEPKFLAELEIIWQKRNPSLIELIHKEIIENTASKSNELTQNDDEYLEAFENVFKLNLPKGYKELIKRKEEFSYVLDLPRTIIEIPDFNNFTYFLDLEGKFDKSNPCPRNVKGVLRIADFGCGVSHILILNGEEKGNIWIDDRANADKIFPYLNSEKQKVNFDMWMKDNGMEKMYAN